MTSLDTQGKCGSSAHDEMEYKAMGFFSRGYKSASFDNEGDEYEGTIVAMPDVRQRTGEDGKPKFHIKSGNPAMMMIIPIQTTRKDDDEDDGIRGVYVNKYGKMFEDLGRELKEYNLDDVEVGAYLKVKWTGNGTPWQKGGIPPKLYTVKYLPPDRNPLTNGNGHQPQSNGQRPERATSVQQGNPAVTGTGQSSDEALLAGLDAETLKRLAAIAAKGNA